jgi:hypothetical protein
VRQREHPRVILERALREVAHIGVQLAGIESRHHRRLIDDGGTREIEDGATRAHESKPRAVHERARVIIQRHVHGDDVGARKQVLQRQRLLSAR